MASGPNLVEIICRRAAIVSSASSQEMRSKTSACFPAGIGPFATRAGVASDIALDPGSRQGQDIRHLSAKKSPGYRMIRIASDFCGATFLVHRDMHAARVRAVQWANRMHNFQGIHIRILG